METIINNGENNNNPIPEKKISITLFNIVIF